MVEGHLLLHLRKHNKKGVLDAGSKEDDDKDEMNKKTVDTILPYHPLMPLLSINQTESS